ncbi:AMP-dependent synthetase and ligase [Cupriavidus taiwanensis]|nr:AMP-dependent synthetase and ligase [Cupriavidus taiwanensis]SPA34447.1 AMP-dependent synthetase and ligase [Cupriavidus taiwanensis]
MIERAVASSWNFGTILDGVARVVPGDRPAIVSGDRVLSWRDFDWRTNRLARKMIAAGLNAGDRVAILARNATEYLEIVAATYKARLAWVNLNYRYTSAEIEYVLKDCDARAIFYQKEFATTVAPVVSALPRLAMVVPIDEGRDYDALTGEGHSGPLGIERSPEDSYFLYTGGTTGMPKGVVWRMGDARAVQLESPTLKPVATLEEHLAAVSNAPAGRVLPACPLMHGAGTNSSIGELLNGGTAILLTGKGFDAEELWDAAERGKATRILIVGDVFARPMVEALRAHPGRWNLSCLKVISSAGLMWSKEVKAALIELLPEVTLIDILGASEASNLGFAFTTATRSTPTGLFEPSAATVLVAPDYSRILDKDEAGPGLLGRRLPFALGYFGDPAKTAATFRDIGGELIAVPGDLAERTPEGWLRLIGRDSMVINTGGEKVFAEEVEEALKRAPGVIDALVVGVPDEKWGKAVVALVQTGTNFDEAAVRERLLNELAPYKLPKRILRFDAVPRHASGKGDYRRAAAMVAEA